MKLLKLLFVLAFFLLSQSQADPNLVFVGSFTIPPGLSWYTCSENRTNYIQYNLQVGVAAAVSKDAAPAVGNFSLGVITIGTLATEDGNIDAVVIRKKNINQYFDLDLYNETGKLDFYREYSCLNNNVPGCKKKVSLDKKPLDYDFQCLIFANRNSFNVSITYDLSFLPVEENENDATTLSGETIQILLIGFISVLASQFL